jgi:hypothetical protein
MARMTSSRQKRQGVPLLVALLAVGCQRSTPLQRNGDVVDGAAGAAQPDLAAPTPLDGRGGGFEVGAATDLAAAPTTCAEDVQAARPALDLLLLIDRSGSMSTIVKGSRFPKWVLVRDGLVGFVKQPETAGLGMGVQFFPLQPSACATDDDCQRDGDFCQAPGLCRMGDRYSEMACGRGFALCLIGSTCVPGGTCPVSGAVCADIGKPCPGAGATDDVCQPVAKSCFEFTDCSPAPYRAPLVPLVELPAGQTQVLAGLAQASARGRATPILAAASGVLEHLRAHLAANPGRRPVLVMATDGGTFGCNETNAQIVAALQKAAQGAPSIPTYLIGVAEDAANMDLKAFAVAGGTSTPFVIADSGDLDRRFLDVLNQIRSKESACDFTIPAPQQGKVAFDRVNVDLSVKGATPATQAVLYVHDAARCDATRGGWYYDVDPATGQPTRIILCDTSCRSFKGDGTNKVAIRFGCQTRVID